MLSPKGMGNIAIRNIRANNVQQMQRAFKYEGLFDNDMLINLYYSVGKFKEGIPCTNNVNNWSVNKDSFKNEYYKVMTEYDFFIDIDAKRFEDMDIAHKSACNILAFLKKKGYDIEVRFSGRGFHIVVPYKHFKDLNLSFDPNQDNNIYNHYLGLARYLFDNISELIDLSVYDSRRIIKLPYSLVFYKIDDDIKVMVSYVFKTNDEFINFELKDYELSNFIQRFLI